MSGTQISGASHDTTPINPASRIPIADPNQAGAKLSASASDVARSGSPVVVTLSSMGIVSDAVNGLGYGVSPPAGSTGQEVAINAALASAYTNAGVAGLRVIWDVAVALGGPVYIPGSNTTIICPSKACGAILRNAAMCPLIRSPGTNANMAIAQNTQNTFGKFDPAAPGGSQLYRVYDSAFVGATNLEIRGGTWNGNAPGQSTILSSTYGLIAIFQLWGIDGLTLDDMTLIQGRCYHLFMCNVSNVVITRIVIDGDSSGNNDGIHVNGPAQFITMRDLLLRTQDDCIAINADDGSYGTIGVNGTAFGDIVNVLIESYSQWLGTYDNYGGNAIRLLSTVHQIDNVLLKDATIYSGILVGNYASAGITGPGKIGHIVFDNLRQPLFAVFVASARMDVYANTECIEVRNQFWFRMADTNINVRDCTVQKLIVDNFECAASIVPAGAAVVKVASALSKLEFRGTFSANGVSIAGSTFLTTDTGADIGFAQIDGHGDSMTNLVNHAAGTIGTLILKGAHTNAGGGSPLDVSSGATVTNYCVSAAGGNLAYVLANGAHSGIGTVTHTDVYSGP